jgi:hypothetical protein
VWAGVSAGENSDHVFHFNFPLSLSLSSHAAFLLLRSLLASLSHLPNTLIRWLLFYKHTHTHTLPLKISISHSTVTHIKSERARVKRRTSIWKL